MIVDDAHFVGIAAVPAEDDAPLLIDPYAVEAFQVTLQRLQAIPARREHVLKTPGCVEHVEFSDRRPDDVGWEPPRLLALASMEEGFCRPVAEGDNHAMALSFDIIPPSRLPCNRDSLPAVEREWA